MSAAVEVHDGEPAHDGRVEDPIPPRAAIAFKLDDETTTGMDRMFQHPGAPGQVVLYMVPQHEHTAPVGEGNDCLVLQIDEVVPLIRWLVGAYASRMEATLWDVAAGGCRTCQNRRTVWNRDLEMNVECPTCSPRAEERIRARLWFRHWPRRR